MRLFFAFIIIFFNQAFSYVFAFDRELAESARCVNFFHYYEKKLKIPQDTLYSISINESGKIHSNKKHKIVWPWTVNVEGAGYYFNSKREAVAFVKDQMNDGKTSIDVGCMQINLKHHKKAFKSIEEAFDPRSNIEYAANFLISKFSDLGTWGAAISHYHSATPHLGEKYKKNVIKIAQNIDKYKSAYKKTNVINVNHNYYKSKPSRLYAKSNNRNSFANSKFKRYKSNLMVYIPQNKG